MAAEAEAPTSDLQGRIDALEAALRAQQDANARLLRARRLEVVGQLASGIADEINTPAQYVTDNLAFLQRAFGKLWSLIEAQTAVVEAARAGPVPPELLTAVDALRVSVKLDYLGQQLPRATQQSLEGLAQLAAIVTAMKDFSRPSTLERQAVDVHELIEASATIAKHEWKYVAEVDFDFDWSLPPVLLLRREFSLVLLTLLINSARALASQPSSDADASGSEKGKITISTRASGAALELRVSDSARGLGSDLRARLVEPWLTPNEAKTGTGDGLVFCRAVVAEHGGELTVEDDPQRGGTSFVIHLPLGGSVPGIRRSWPGRQA